MKTRNLIALTAALEDAFYTSTGAGASEEFETPCLSGELGEELLQSIGGLMGELGTAISEIQQAQKGKLGEIAS